MVESTMSSIWVFAPVNDFGDVAWIINIVAIFRGVLSTSIGGGVRIQSTNDVPVSLQSVDV